MATDDTTPRKDQTNAAPKIDDLPAKDRDQSADASKVKGGVGPVDALISPKPIGPVDGYKVI